jgi:hypothetical protein
MSKRNAGWDAEESKEVTTALPATTFPPDEKTIGEAAGSAPLEAAQT